MSLLITGGSGYLASNILFRKKKNNVKILSSRLIDNFYDVNKFEVYNYTSIDNNYSEILEGVDTVIHTAALNANRSYNEKNLSRIINYDLTKKLFDACVKENIKNFIFFSTAHVYSNNLKGIINEKTPTSNIQSPYAKNKINAENYLISNKNKINLKILRISNVFGCSQIFDSNSASLLFNSFCLSALKSKKINILSKKNFKRNFITLYDFLNVIDYIINNENKFKNIQIINIGSDITLSILQAANIIKEIYYKLYNYKLPINYNFENDSNDDFNYDISLLKKTGFELVNNLEQTIEDTFNFYSKNINLYQY